MRTAYACACACDFRGLAVASGRHAALNSIDEYTGAGDRSTFTPRGKNLACICVTSLLLERKRKMALENICAI